MLPLTPNLPTPPPNNAWARAITEAIANLYSTNVLRLTQLFSLGVTANRPAADGSAKMYFDTTTKLLQVDDGSWEDLSGLVPTVPSYTLAGLPAAGTAGRLARVTDNIRGLWIDTGTQWKSITGHADVKDFGAKGDNVTDDSAAFQAAIDAASNQPVGTVFIPIATGGNYVLATGLVSQGSTRIFGAGYQYEAGGHSG